MPVSLNLKPVAPVELHVQILWASLEDEEHGIAYSLETSTWWSVQAGDIWVLSYMGDCATCSILSLNINWSPSFSCFPFAAKLVALENRPWGRLPSKCGSCGNRKVSTFIISVSQLLFHASLISINSLDQTQNFCKGPYFLPKESPSHRLSLWSKSLSYPHRVLHHGTCVWRALAQ